MCISTRHALSSFWTTSPFPNVSFIFFLSLKVLIFCVRTKDLSINSALLPLSMSKQVYIPAMLALNTRCLPSIFGTSSRTAHVETLTRLLVAKALPSTQFFVFCPWSQFWSRTMLFPTPNHWPLQLKLLSYSTLLFYWSMDNTRRFYGVLILCISSTFLAGGAWHARHPRVFVGKSPGYTTFLFSQICSCIGACAIHTTYLSSFLA